MNTNKSIVVVDSFNRGMSGYSAGTAVTDPIRKSVATNKIKTMNKKSHAQGCADRFYVLETSVSCGFGEGMFLNPGDATFGDAVHNVRGATGQLSEQEIENGWLFWVGK